MIINDTCVCGAEFNVCDEFSSNAFNAHSKWLETHKNCRNSNCNKLAIEIPTTEQNNNMPIITAEMESACRGEFIIKLPSPVEQDQNDECFAITPQYVEIPWNTIKAIYSRMALIAAGSI